MAVKPTSILAYRKLIESGEARIQRDHVFACIMKHSDDGISICREQIAHELGYKLSSICGRVAELLEMKMIKVAYMAESPYPPHSTVEFLELIPMVYQGEQPKLL